MIKMLVLQKTNVKSTEMRDVGLHLLSIAERGTSCQNAGHV